MSSILNNMSISELNELREDLTEQIETINEDIKEIDKFIYTKSMTTGGNFTSYEQDGLIVGTDIREMNQLEQQHRKKENANATQPNGCGFFVV